jgi:hypothetical protein
MGKTRNWWGVLTDYSHLNPAFLAATSGLICGEGCLTFSHQRGNASTPRLAVILHRSDADCLKEIHRQLGGNYYEGKTRPSAVWVMMGIGRVLSTLYIILPYARLLKSAKVADMEVMQEYCEWRISQPRTWGRSTPMPPEVVTRKQEFVQLLKSVKVRG